MSGRFMKKEVLLTEAERLGVDLGGLTWPQQQKAVLDAQDEERSGREHSRKSLEEIIEIIDESPVETKEVVVHVDVHEPDFMERVRGKKLIICPEMAPTPTQLFGYEEELGDDLVVEETIFELGNTGLSTSKDLATGTFNVKGKTGKKVVAQCGMPKEGCEISFRPDRDWFPVCTFQGRSGYLWTHHRLPNVKDALIKSGYYEDYRERFKDEPFIWHSAGKLLACDINLVHSVMRDIERKAGEAKVADAQRTAFVDSQLR